MYTGGLQCSHEPQEPPLDAREYGRRLYATVLLRQYDLGLTQRALVAQLGMTPQRINNWYAGTSAPNVLELRVLADALELDYRFLVDPPVVVPRDGRYDDATSSGWTPERLAAAEAAEAWAASPDRTWRRPSPRSEPARETE